MLEKRTAFLLPTGFLHDFRIVSPVGKHSFWPVRLLNLMIGFPMVLCSCAVFDTGYNQFPASLEPAPGMQMVALPAGRVAVPPSIGERRPSPLRTDKEIALKERALQALVSGSKTRRSIRVFQPFLLAATETTQGQWLEIMGTNPSSHRGDLLPVNNVSYLEAVRFCEKLTAREHASGRLPDGFEYRLPTRDQWEYAFHYGATRSRSQDLDSLAWFRDNSGGRPHPVARKQPTGAGFYDLLGNVAEWCLAPANHLGSLSASPYGEPRPTLPTPGYPPKIMAVGGHFADCASVLVHDRESFWFDYTRSPRIGFRVVLTQVKEGT